MNGKRQVKLLKRGDERALEEIILTYTNYVATVIINQLGGFYDTSIVEELSSDVFFSLWKNRLTITSDNLKSWLGTTARNKAKNHIRSKVVLLQHVFYTVNKENDSTKKNDG